LYACRNLVPNERRVNKKPARTYASEWQNHIE